MAVTAEDREQARLIAAWRADPVAFFVGPLKTQPWRRQAEILRSVARHPRVAVRSGHKIGKSTSAAGLALWWISTRPRARAILTSSSDRQVKSILWPELRRLHALSGGIIGGSVALDPGTGLRLPNGNDIIGFSTDKPENMGGFSGKNLLFIPDEASGIPEPIFEAIEGNRAGGAHIVMFGNPTQTSGTFFDAFNSKRDFWHAIHVSSEETPNVVEGREVVPGLATREWVEEKRREWGEDSLLYAVRVAGNFPGQASDVLIALTFVDAATERWNETSADGRLELGVDVAEFGDDDSVIQPRRGLKALEPRVVHGMDAVDVAANAMAVVRDLRRPGEKPRVKVDVIGIGAGVAAILSREKDVEVVRVNSSETPEQQDPAAQACKNVRALMWTAARDWLKAGGAFKADAKLEAELVAPKYSFDAHGRLVLESKKDFKKRLRRSPDRADALCMSIYDPPAELVPPVTDVDVGSLLADDSVRSSPWNV